MPVAAVVAGGAILGSSIIGSRSAKKAGQAQADAAGKATDAQVQANRENIAFQKAMFEQQRKDNAPWRQIGEQSLKQLQGAIKSGKFDPGDFKFNFNFQADPGYQFRQQQGINALDASAAARGRLQSGAQNKAVTRYASDLASQEYGNAFSRAFNTQLTDYQLNAARKGDQFNQLASLANVGQVASSADQAARSQMTQNVGGSTLNTGNAIAQGAINQGNARASAYQGQAQAIQGGIGNLLTLGLGGI